MKQWVARWVTGNEIQVDYGSLRSGVLYDNTSELTALNADEILQCRCNRIYDSIYGSIEVDGSGYRDVLNDQGVSAR